MKFFSKQIFFPYSSNLKHYNSKKIVKKDDVTLAKMFVIYK